MYVRIKYVFFFLYKNLKLFSKDTKKFQNIFCNENHWKLFMFVLIISVLSDLMHEVCVCVCVVNACHVSACTIANTSQNFKIVQNLSYIVDEVYIYLQCKKT